MEQMSFNSLWAPEPDTSDNALPPMNPSDNAVAAQHRQAAACHEEEVQRFGLHPDDTKHTE